MSSKTNHCADRNLRKHPLESDSFASSNVCMENKRQKVHVVRDFPAGCGPFINPIGFWGCGHGSFTLQSNILSEKDEEDDDPPVEDAESQSPTENLSDTESDSFLKGEDYNDSGVQCFGNSRKSPAEEGQSDSGQSELDCCENCETDEELEIFGQSYLLCVNNSEVDDNFDQLESSDLIREDFDNVGRDELLEEEDLEVNRVNHYPPWRLRSFSAVRDFPSGCGP